MQSLSDLVPLQEVCAALEAAPRKVQQECGKHQIPIIKLGHKSWMTKENISKLLGAMECRYIYPKEGSTGLREARSSGAQSQSSYENLQDALLDEKHKK